MATISEKLNTLNTIKSDIKGALEAKGATPNDDFTTYATEIQNLSTGGGDTSDPDIIQLCGLTLGYANKVEGKKYNINTDYYNNTALSYFFNNCDVDFTLSDFLINNKPEYGLLQLSSDSTTIYSPGTSSSTLSMSCYHLYNTNTDKTYIVKLNSNFKDEVLDKKLFADNVYKSIEINGFGHYIENGSVVNKLLNNIDWSKVYCISHFFQHCGSSSSASDDETNLVIENDINLNLSYTSSTYIMYFPSFKTMDMTKFRIKYSDNKNYNDTFIMNNSICAVYYASGLTTFKTPTIDFSCMVPYTYKKWNSWDTQKPSYISSDGGYDIQAGPTGIKSSTFTFFESCSKLTNIKYNVIGPIKINIKLGSCSSSMDMSSFSDVINALYNWKVNPDNYMSSHKIIMSTTLQNKLSQVQKDAIAERGWILATS